MNDWRSLFGFHTAPFTRELAVAQRFPLPMFDEVLTALFRAVDQRGSAALVAPAGTGKTALLRALVDQLPEARYRVHYVKVTSIGKRDLCREMAAACGLAPTAELLILFRWTRSRAWPHPHPRCATRQGSCPRGASCIRFRG